MPLLSLSSCRLTGVVFLSSAGPAAPWPLSAAKRAERRGYLGGSEVALFGDVPMWNVGAGRKPMGVM
eukprot:91429-Pyramimonas_sp.AAC.1